MGLLLVPEELFRYVAEIPLYQYIRLHVQRRYDENSRLLGITAMLW